MDELSPTRSSYSTYSSTIKPRHDATHFVQYGDTVAVQRGRTPTFALRTGGGYVFASGTPARERELAQRVTQLEALYSEATSERNMLLVDLKEQTANEAKAMAARDHMTEQIQFHVNNYQQLEAKYEGTLKTLEQTRVAGETTLQEHTNKADAAIASLQILLDKAKEEIEHLKRDNRESVQMSEVKANGLRDLIAQLKQEKQELHNANELTCNDKGRLQATLEQSHARAAAAEKKCGEVQAVNVRQEQENIALQSSLAQAQERIAALNKKLEDMEKVSGELATVSGAKTSLEAELRGVSQALALATKDLAEARHQNADLTQKHKSSASQMAMAEDKAAKLAEANQNLTNELKATKDQLKVTEEKLKMQTDNFNKSNDDHNKTQTKLNDEMLKANTLQRTVEEKAGEIKRLTAALADQTAALKNVQDSSNQTQKDKDAVIADVKAQLKATGEELTATKAELRLTKTKLQETADLLAQRDNDVASERAARNQLAVETDSTKKTLSSQQSTSAVLEHQLKETTDQLTALEAKYKSLDAECKTVKEEAEKAKATLFDTQRVLSVTESKLEQTDTSLKMRGQALAAEEKLATELREKAALVESQRDRAIMDAELMHEEKRALEQRTETLSVLLNNERNEVEVQRKMSQKYAEDYQTARQALADFKLWASAAPTQRLAYPPPTSPSPASSPISGALAPP